MKYKLVWNTECCSDNYELPIGRNKDAAKCDLKDVYIEWMIEEQNYWKFNEDYLPEPTEKQKESWDRMIEEYSCYIIPWDEETGDYSVNEEDEIWLSDEELADIGWYYWMN